MLITDFLTLLRTIVALGLICFLPGYLFLRLIRSRIPLNWDEQYLLSIPVSIALSGLTYLVAWHALTLPTTTFWAFLLPVVLSLVLGALQYLPFIARQSTERNGPVRKDWAPYYLVTAAILAVHVANYLLYPFLPEADGYSLIEKISQALQIGSSSGFSYRPFLPIFSLGTSLTTGLAPLTEFKYIFPLLIGILPLFAVAASRRLKATTFQQVVTGLILLSVPVITLETDYVRPQSIIILFFGVAIWLLWRFTQTKNWYYWLAAFGLGAIGLLAHEFAIFILAACLLIVFPNYWRVLKASTTRTVLISLIVLIGVYPYVHPLLIAGPIPAVLDSIKQNIWPLHFRVWFINSYQNSDGNNLGWPGILGVLYYGYNIGIAMPFVLLFACFLKKKPLSAIPAKLFFAVGLLPLLFGEILPRFSVFYLPDRAWLFLAITLAFWAALYVAKLAKNQLIFISVCAVLCIFITWGLVWYKEGWITPKEYQAVQWIKQNTPTNAYLITQSGSVDPFRVYASRSTGSAANFFSDPALAQDVVQGNAIVLNATANQNNVSTLKLLVQKDLKTVKATSNQAATQEAIKTLETDTQSLKDAVTNLENATEIPALGNQPTYIVYSTDKFNSLYGSRSWWETINEYGAHPMWLTQPAFTIVYQQNGITIWKVNPTTGS